MRARNVPEAKPQIAPCSALLRAQLGRRTAE